MSEEVAQSAADLATITQLRSRILEWEDCYDRLAGAFELHMDILECKQAMSDYAGVFYDIVIGEQADRADQFEAALAVAMQENEGWRTLATIHQQRHHDAWVLIGRIDMALELLPKKPSLRAIQLLVKQLRGEIASATKAKEP